jgi:hypothetical protein
MLDAVEHRRALGRPADFGRLSHCGSFLISDAFKALIVLRYFFRKIRANARAAGALFPRSRPDTPGDLRRAGRPSYWASLLISKKFVYSHALKA